MKSPAIRRSLGFAHGRHSEAGVTILLVAAALVAIMAMAALSIDAVTLYLANVNAQQAADAGALAGARMLSLSGMTGDPQNNSGNWAAACQLAQQVATAVADQITVGNTVPASVQVTFPNDPTSNCTGGGGTATLFGVNPEVQVKVQSTQLPTFFAKIWGRSGSSVSATATAEVFNSSNSGSFSASADVIPVQPRCVKPWIVPNSDPGNPGNPFVSNANGSIQSSGIRLGGVGTGVVGESFTLAADCGNPTEPCNIKIGAANNPPAAVGNTLQYLPGAVPSFSSAVPSCATATPYEEAVGGCDQRTVYQCGVPKGSAGNPNAVDLSENPGGPAGDTSNGAQCLIHEAGGAGQDVIDTTSYPYQIKTGAGNPLGLATGSVVTSSNSIVSLPIYDGAKITPPNGTIPVTIVGFLQVFINNVDTVTGNVNVTVLNVTGCGNGTNAVGPAVSGTSPVPVRLITYP
jgi:hypothetical protein